MQFEMFSGMRRSAIYGARRTLMKPNLIDRLTSALFGAGLPRHRVTRDRRADRNDRPAIDINPVSFKGL
jgi:hypothetical protein